jgi:hypothetical protein
MMNDRTMLLESWGKIAPEFTDLLIVGNGASIAISENFKYKNLYDYGKIHSIFSESEQAIFDKFEKHSDFERVLFRLWQADFINDKFGITNEERQKVRQGYINVRRALINTVKSVHPEAADVYRGLMRISKFIGHFKTTVSLNYDLLLDWSAEILKQGGIKIEDGFSLEGTKKPDDAVKRYLFDAGGLSDEAKKFFHLHGSLALYQTAARLEEKKLKPEISNKRFFGELTSYWAKGDRHPLFVSEGRSENKLEAINSSRYLSHVYHRVLPASGPTLTIYGWSMSEQDQHVIDKLKDGNFRKAAVSVYRRDNEPERATSKKMEDMALKLEEMGIHDIHFFDSRILDA